MATTVTVAEPTRAGVALLVTLRLLLLAGLLLCSYQQLTTADDRPFGDLQGALARGVVEHVTVRLPPAGRVPSGTSLLWSGKGLRPRISTSPDADGSAESLLQEMQASRGRPDLTFTQRVNLDPRRPPGLSYPAAIPVFLGVVGLIRWGPRPRLATRWAWLWLGVSPVAWRVFVLVEPSLFRRLDIPERTPLTGGKALVAGILVTANGRATAPDLTGVLW